MVQPLTVEELLQDIQPVRDHRTLWAQLTCDYGDGQNDKNWRKRYAVTIGLQYDWTEGDEELLRFIVDNEVAMHRRAPCQGLFESLRLSSYLLARFKNPANAGLFAAAKTANFDTQ